jgi:uncharacterized protein YdaU (DUF1376 family)
MIYFIGFSIFYNPYPNRIEMAKDPAFLFYPNDWLGGTMGMSFEEKGAYLELLLMQFNRGHMTEHMIRHMVGQLWDKIKVKFSVDDDGLYYNKRLKVEHENRKSYSASRRNNLKGTNQHTKKTGHMTSHMENEDENEDENEIKDRGMGKGWDTKPGKELLGMALDETKGGAVIQLFKLSKNHDLTNEELKTLWNAFKAQNFTGETYYASANKVYSHFINWSKTQIVNGKPNSTTGKNSYHSKTAGQDVFADRFQAKLGNLKS